CSAVVSVSECLNYKASGRNHRRDLTALFRRIYHTLIPGGVFVFDMAVPGQVAPGITATVFTEGEDWLVLAAKQEDAEKRVLTRRIVTFRRSGSQYRRSEEVHKQALYPSSEIADALRDLGFTVRVSQRYGAFKLPKARAAFVARKALAVRRE
ncbi:MAG TPA: class I SAM-dependent methyltransferase, partial [Blastocatellia bacterium]|nr:class I SAM-dependent methyltransferase [Blastocatellia bacterium]